MSDALNSNSSLYVGDLHDKVTEKVLFEHFKDFGNILSVRICRHNMTKKSLCYGYVNFEKQYEAQHAMDTLNLSEIKGQPCRIMWYEKDPSKRKSGVGNIVIKNLDEWTTVKEINDVFSKFGIITSCKLRTTDDGVSTGWAFVNYQTEGESENAIRNMNKKKLGHNKITVERFLVKGHVAKECLTQCYIDNCPVHVDDSLLRIIFEKYGVVYTAKVMLTEGGVSKGFGFVNFKEQEDAARATKHLNGTIIQNKRIHVYRVLHNMESPNISLSVNNLSRKINDERLHREFSSFGNVVSAKVAVNPINNVSLGHGIVSFVDFDSANIAMREMNGQILDGMALFVTFNNDSDPHKPGVAQPPIFPVLPFPNAVNPLRMPVWPANLPMIRIPYPEMFPVQLRPNIINNSPKRMIGEKIYPLVCQYAGVNAPNVMSKLMNLSVEELFSIVKSGDTLKYRVLELMEEFKEVVDPVRKEDLNTDENNVGESDSLSDEDSKSGSSVDNEDSIQFKKSLGCKLYKFVEELSGEMANDIVSLFMTFGHAELMYMLENEEYLKIKIEEAKKEISKHQIGDCVENGSSDDREKQRLGEKIYSTVSKYAGNLAGKITGMFLKLDKMQLNHLLEHEDLLRRKIEAVVLFYNVHGTLDGHRWEDSGSNEESNVLAKTEMNSVVEGSDTIVQTEDLTTSGSSSMIKRHSINMPYLWTANIPVFNQPQLRNIMYPAITQAQQTRRTRMVDVGALKMEKEGEKTGEDEKMNIKQYFGEKIYPMVRKHAGASAGKITGMLLELDNLELACMLENKELLMDKIEEAMAVINAHMVENSLERMTERSELDVINETQ